MGTKVSKFKKRKTLNKAFDIVNASESPLLCREIVEKIEDDSITVGRLSQWLKADKRFKKTMTRIYVPADTLNQYYSGGHIYEYTIFNEGEDLNVVDRKV